MPRASYGPFPVIIRLSKSLSLMASYLYSRGNTFHFRLRVPDELADRYPVRVIRKSLKTTDPREAVRLAEVMYQQYQASFSAMRGNADLTPADTHKAAQALADSLPPLEYHTDFFDQKYHAYAAAKGLDEWTLQQNPDIIKESDYLSPVERRALQILKAGSHPSRRLSDALDIYLKTHRSADNKKAMDRAKRDWGQLTDLVGDIALTDLAREHGRAFVTQCLSKGMKTTTARRAVNSLNAIFNVGVRELDIKGAGAPFSDLPIANEGKDAKDVKTPSAQELGEILKTFAAELSDPALVILIQMGIGSRVGEVSGLAVTDVVLDAETPYLKIQEQPWRSLKTLRASTRDVPLVGFVLEATKLALAQPRSKGCLALFERYGKESGNATASATNNQRLKPWGIGTHGFRHGMKDLLREVGCPDAIQKEIQGHAGDGHASNYGKGYSLRVKAEWLAKAHAMITIAK